ncbi:hypothetical protein [Leptospira tipperaryensis]|nr:hypothetical protein [Leptospira tipperaryensis]
MKIIPVTTLQKKSELTHSVYANDYHLIFETRKKVPWLNPHSMIQIRNLFRKKC